MKIVIRNKKQKHFMVIYIALIGMLLIMLALPLEISFLVSIGTWMIVFSAISCVIPCIIKQRVSKETIMFLTVVLLSTCFYLFSGEITYSTLVTLLCFFELPCFFLYFESIKNRDGRNIKSFIYWSFLGLSIYFFLISLSDVAYEYKTIYGVKIIEELTLGFSNQNQTGMYLLVTIFVLINAISYFPNKKMKIFYFVMTLISLYLIFLTKSRMCIILAILFIFYNIFSLNRFSRFNRIMWKISFYVPFLFVGFVSFIDKFNVSFEILGEVFETGRLNIYRNVFDNMNLINFICGDYKQYLFENLHNAYMSIFASLGIVVLLAYVGLIYISFEIFWNKAQEKSQQIIFFSLVLLLIHSSVESGFFTQGSANAVLVFALVCLLLDDKQEKGIMK